MLLVICLADRSLLPAAARLKPQQVAELTAPQASPWSSCTGGAKVLIPGAFHVGTAFQCSWWNGLMDGCILLLPLFSRAVSSEMCTSLRRATSPRQVTLPRSLLITHVKDLV